MSTKCDRNLPYDAGTQQIGGSHYNVSGIQPIDFIHSNNIPYMEANVIKYVFRHKNKNGAEDIRKAIHYLELLLEREYA